MSKKYLAVYSGSNPYYLAVILDLVNKFVKIDHEFIFLDLTKNKKNRQKNSDFHSMLLRKGVRILFQNAKDPSSKEIEDWWNKNSTEEDEVSLEQSLTSAMVTFTRDETPSATHFHNLLRRKLRHEALASGKLVEDAIVEHHVTDIFIPNGRFPYQNIANLIAVKRGVKKMFFEQGEQGPQTYFLEKFHTLDRLETQLDLSERIKIGFTLSEKKSAENWFESRINGQNVFGRLWSPKARLVEEKSANRVVIFSSSEDEYAELGQDWKTHDWENQWKAIESVSQYLIELGYQVILRVHPNIVAKSHSSFKRNIRNQKVLKNAIPKVKILGHEDGTNSYELVKSASLVVVWNSTVGLESTYLGKPTICLTSAFYDELVDVIKCHNIQEFKHALDVSHLPDPQKAVAFRAALNARDHWLGPESINVYEELLQKEFTSKISRFIKIPDLSISLQLWIDLLRHRSLANSFRLAKKYFGRQS